MATFDPMDPIASSTFDATSVASPFNDYDRDAASDSLYNVYVGSPFRDAGVQQAPGRQLQVNYADTYQRPGAYVGHSSDTWTLDSDPFGTKTVEYGRRVGKPYTSTDILSLNVFGREMGVDQLAKTSTGRRLIEIARDRRTGHKRGFLEALTDFSWSDVPFLSLVASVGGSIRDAVTVSDTMKKLQNGEKVTDDELIKTRLYLAENEYRSQGTWGSTVGDIIRAAPGFMAEFFVSGGIFSTLRTAATKAAGTGIHLGLSRSAKILARESTQHFAEEATAKTVGKLGSKAFAGLAEEGMKETREKIIGKVSEQLFGFMKGPNGVGAGLYKGMSEEAMKDLAANRAKYEFAEMMARNAGGSMSNSFNKFGQWLKINISRGLMDYGAWGTEESTVLFTGHTKAGRALADAAGTFFVEAPVKGAMMLAPNQFLVRPAVGELFGKDGRVVSDTQLSLQQSALMTDNKSLMDSAESIAFGINMLEYVSENTGRGLGSMLTAAGMGLEKLGVKGLVRPASRAVTQTGELLAEAGEDAVSVGGRMRKFVSDIFGTREQYAQRMGKERVRLVAEKLGIGEGADRIALQEAILSNSAEKLRPDLRQMVGDNVSKFVDGVLDEAYRSGRRDLEYKTYARYAVAKWMNKHQVGPETVMNLYNQMGYDGILGEMFEERYSDVVKGMLGLDDRAEHDFFSNLKEAVKGLYPGWDQLTAEAVGFAMPMVTRMGVMRLQSAIGGEGKVREILSYLEHIDDAMRHDTSVQMSYGQYLATDSLLSQRDERTIEALKGKLEEARTAKDTELQSQLASEIETQTKVLERRRERHQKFVSSLTETAKANTDAIITVPLLSNETLADDEKYSRAPLINSEQAAEGLSGQTAIVDFSPELARRIYEAEMPLEGETDSWYRKAAHKIVGVAGALVTGDFSLAATNPAHWTARDMGLSENVLSALKAGFKETYEKTRSDFVAGRIGPRAEMERLRKEIAHLKSTIADGTASADVAAKITENQVAYDKLAADNKGTAYEASVASVMDEAQRRFAARAKQIMSANLAAHQLRSFADGRMRDQALLHVASTVKDVGDDREYNYSVDKDGKVSFYKLSEDGRSVDESTVVTADEFARRHEAEVKKAHDQIVSATVDLMTRGLTKSDDARRRLLAAVRHNAESELLDASIYSAAMHMIGQENLVNRVRIDGRTPLAEVMRGQSVGHTNMKLVDYIATKASVKEVDERAFESIAHSIGFRFDGTEAGLAKRNDKIFRMAKLASMLRREGVAHYTRAIVSDETLERVSPNGMETLVAKRNADGTSWSVDLGLNHDGSPNRKPFATKEELDSWMADNGYSVDTARIVFTQAKVVESSDMFHMLRELGLAKQYAALYEGARENDVHPALRKDADGNYLPFDSELTAEQRAKKTTTVESVLREELALASKGAHAERGSEERGAWERLWGEKGYMRVGERILALNGVKKNTVSKYAGEFSEYTPTLYTLSLSAGRLSSRSADVFVPIDPSVNSDVMSGVVNALLLHGYQFNARLLKDKLNGSISDFLHQVDGVIDTHLSRAQKAKDAELVTSLKMFRRLCTEEIDRVVRGDDGKLRVHRGYGLTAQGFTVLGSAFCLYRDREYLDNPILRAVADVADDVRTLPAYSEFLNVVDLVLGGNGFLSEAARNAVRGQDDANAQTGVQRLMSFATGDPGAFRKAVRSSLPGGLSYTKFLDVCTRKLTAMEKSGAPLISEKEKNELRELARQASADTEEAVRKHFTFLGNLIGTVKGLIDTGKIPSKSFVDFLRDAATDAKGDPNNTEEQREAIDGLLGILQRSATADVQTEEYDKALDRAQTAESALMDARQKLAEVTKKLAEYELKREESNRKARERYAKKHGVTVDSVPADAVTVETVDQKTQDELAASRAEVITAEAAAKKAAEALEKQSVPSTLQRADFKGGVSQQSVYTEGYVENDVDVETDEDATADDGEDFDMTIGSDAMAVDVPEVFAKAVFGAETKAFTMRKGHILTDNEDHLLTRSQARLATNLVVRSLVATGDAVSENDFMKRTDELFPALVASEREDVVTAFRTADDARIRAGKEWSDFAVAGQKWDFGDDTKSDEDVSSDNFNNQSLGEYNSDEVADFLALAQRSTPETGRNLQGFLRLAKETARSLADTDPHAKFLRDVLNPKLDERATTQALASAYLMQTFDRFDTADAGDHIRGLLVSKNGHPVSRRGAFLISYLSSLPSNVRVKFGLLCANSVAATPVRLDPDSKELGTAHRKSGGKVPESLVVDSFHRLVGTAGAEALRLAGELDKAAERLVKAGMSKTDLAANAKAVADEIAVVFGKESPLYSALSSDMSRQQWSTLPESTRKSLLSAVTADGNGRIGVLSTIAAALRVLGSFEGTLTRGDVASVFTAAFAVGDPSRGGLKMAPSTARITDPLMTFLSSFQDSLPETIMNAEIDQQRESKGSSVAVAPRDLVPMLSRWLYSDEKTVMTVTVDGQEHQMMSFAEACRKFYPGVTDETIRECRQDGTWPDARRTPICAKCISTSYNTLEIYDSCKAAYDNRKDNPCWWIPIYAGDHASSTLLQIPKEVNFAAPPSKGPVMTKEDAERAAKAKAEWAARKATPEGNQVDTSKFPKDGLFNLYSVHDWRTVQGVEMRLPFANSRAPAKAKLKDAAKMALANAFIGFGERGSSTWSYQLEFERNAVANTGVYGPSTVAFVSVNGTRSDATRKGLSPEQQKTYAEAIRAIAAGATLITDGFEYAASTSYNVGERRLREILTLLGAKSEQVKTEFGTATKWTMDAATRKTLSDNPVAVLSGAAYPQIRVGDKMFAGHEVRWLSADEMAKNGFKSAAALEDNVIYVSADMMKSKFAGKAWENPERSERIEGFADKVRSVDDLLQFVVLHELAHTFGRWHRENNLREHENWANRWAMRRMATYADVKEQTQDGKPNREDFVDIGDYAQALHEWKMQPHVEAVTRTERIAPPSPIPAEVAGFLTAKATEAVAPAATTRKESVPERPSYEANARAASAAVGLSLMFTDTKRSAVSSLEAQGVGMIGVEDTVEFVPNDENAEIAKLHLDFENNYYFVHRTSEAAVKNILESGFKFGADISGTAMFANSEQVLRDMVARQRRADMVDHEWSDAVRGGTHAVIMSVPKADVAVGDGSQMVRKAGDAFFDKYLGTVPAKSITGVLPIYAEKKPSTRTGENRIHIVRNWGDRSGKNEAFLGSTFVRGYGAKMMKRMAQDPRSATLKAHIISTYGADLFFAKSLCVATEDGTGEFLEGSSGRAMMDYLKKFRGNDELSSDILTDFDSYKIGPAASKALKMKYKGGEEKVMEAVFDRLFESLAEKGAVSKETADAFRSGKVTPTEAQYEELAKVFRSEYGQKLSGDPLDALFGDIEVVDRVRGNRKSKLSELLPGVTVNFVEGTNGPTLDLSYQENGAMAYTVANVSHQSRIPDDPGASPRNYEVDALTMAAVLDRGKWGTDRLMKTVYDLVADWGLVANAVYSSKEYVDSIIRSDEAVQELIRNGEDPNGQNVRQELARKLWSSIRQASNLPLSGVDMPLVSCGASAVGNGVFTHATSPMQQAMMKGSELFSADEAKFYGVDRRMALCNVNVCSKGFRYGWFLDDKAFRSSKWFADNCGVTTDTTGRDVATALAKAFTKLRTDSMAARGKPRTSVEAKAVQEDRKAICDVFVDHHNVKISADKSAVAKFGFEDLFMDSEAGDTFDLSAVQCEGLDLVHNDATGLEHVFLGGTMFGLPRTPSYNGSMWLQTVRAGLPVTERKIKRTDDNGQETEVYIPGRDAMVSPDPFTNKILGCDHDGDKTKVYMLTVNQFGNSEFAMPPSASDETGTFDLNGFLADRQVPNPYASDGGTIGMRGLYLAKILRRNSGKEGQRGFLQNFWFNEETGQEEELKYNDARPGHYFKVSDAARRRVSNSFVRALFNMSRRLPTGEATDNANGTVTVSERRSKGPDSPRVKFVGGVASSETKAFPVSDRNALTGETGKKHVYSESGNIGPEVLKDDGSLGNLGQPEVGARVSTSAADAADARAMAVSMARTLHLAWASGYFHGGDRNMFGPDMNSREAAVAWLRFMYHVDGLSNATFDDIKEQICGRLGWTKDMMDTVITELLVNAPMDGKLPQTDAEFAKVLGAYSRSVKDKGVHYWMLKAADATEAAGTDGFPASAMIRNMFFGRNGSFPGKQKVLTALGIDTDNDGNYTTKAPADGVTAVQAVIRGIAQSDLSAARIGSHRLLGLIQADVASNKGHNPMIGRLYWIAKQAGVSADGTKKLTKVEAEKIVDAVAKSGEAVRLALWANKRSILLGARSFGQSVNYMTADPGDPSAASRSDRVVESYQSMVEFLSDPKRGKPTGGGSAFMADRFARMHAATRLAYNIGGGLQTVAARAVGAALRRKDVLFPNACAEGRANPVVQRIVARLLLRDSVPSFDRMQLEANAQQIPYIAGYFAAFGSLSSQVRDGAFASARQMYNGLQAMASGVRDELGSTGSALEVRHGVESVFSIMYELMVTSSEFNGRDGNKAPAYLRTASDTAYGPKDIAFDGPLGRKVEKVDVYGAAGHGLNRILAMFRANDEESIGRIREMFRKCIAGESFTGKRKVQGAEGATLCADFSVSPKSIFRYAMELAGVRGKEIKAATRENLVKALDEFFGVTKAVDELEKKSKSGGYGKSAFSKGGEFDREAALAKARRNNDRYATILDAWAATTALEKAFGKSVPVNPATMFGQLLPMYTLMTSRTLGAPSPTSPSLMNLLPKSFYAEISHAATRLDALNPGLMSLLIGTSFAPVSERKAVKRRETGTLAKRPETIEPLVQRLDALADEADGGVPTGDAVNAVRADVRGGEEVSEGRKNPDFRNTLDGFSDGLFGDLVEWTESAGIDAYNPPPTQGPKPTDGDYDPKVAKVALAMGSLLGSWAEVEYNGGSVFTIRGRLRGDAGTGKECVIVVDASSGSANGTIDTPEQRRALAKSYGYAKSLCAAKDLGTVTDPVTGEKRRFSAEDFMRLPLSVREGLVAKYGVGGATLNKVAWSSDGRGLATLVGAIRIPAGNGTKVYHEYFHAMMRMFDQIGLLGEADYAALSRQFGKGVNGARFDEEAAAEAFRKWVEGNTDGQAKDTRSVFRKIFDFLKGFFEALCNGFSYTGEVSDDTIFKMVVHGIAQPSSEKMTEIKGRLQAAGATQTLSTLESADSAKVHGAIRKTFTLPEHDATVGEDQLRKVAADQLASSLINVRGGVDELEQAAGFDSLTDAADRKASKAAERKLGKMLEADGHPSDAELSKALCDLAAVRQRMAEDVMRSDPSVAEDSPLFTIADVDPAEAAARAQEEAVAALEQKLEESGIRITDTGIERPEGPRPEDVPPTPGTEEAVKAETHEQVQRTVFPQVKTNDFYRAADFIATALEQGMKENGSWRLPLQSIVSRYAAPTWATAQEEARDKTVLLHGLRRALSSLNPELAKRLTGKRVDATLRNSLVFEAGLRMFHGLERSMVKQTGERGDTGSPMTANGVNDRATHASQFQVSAWITSTRPTAPGALATSARDHIAQLMTESQSGASQAELKLHLDMMDKLVDMVGDVTGLMDFRYDQGMMTLNEVIGRLKAGTKKPTFDENGFMNDIQPIDVNDPSKPLTADNINTENPWSQDHLASFIQSHQDPAVQESLKLALTTAYQVAAMAKFYQELDIVPASADDLVARDQMLKRHRLPEHVSIAEWVASQAIGDSNLCDQNRGLVDHYDQPYFIANNVDSWLSSLVRKSFGAVGNIGEMLLAENHEYGSLKSRVADLENWYCMLFGMNVEDGGEILKVLEHEGQFKMEDGTVVRKVGDKYVKFDNYNRVTCRGVTMTEDDLRVLDLYMKMCSAYASDQTKMVTGVDRLHFDRGMNRDREFYSMDKVLDRYNNGAPSDQMNALEIALVRMTKQLPDHVLKSENGGLGLYDRFVDAALDALAYADAHDVVTVGTEDVVGPDGSVTGKPVTEPAPQGSARYNALVIDQLVKRGLVEGMNRGDRRYRVDNLPMYTKAVLVLDCDEINRHFLLSAAHDKLVKNGRTEYMLSRDKVRDDFMDIYRDAVSFARKHPWLTHGDGQYFNAFGTALPFWRGSGVFMYNAVRSLRDRSTEEIRNLPHEEQVCLNVLSSLNAPKKLSELKDGQESGAIELLASRYNLDMRGKPLVDAIVRGNFADGTDAAARFNLTLPADATVADVAKAIYDSYLDQVWRIQSGEDVKGSLRRAERILDIFEDARLTKGEMFGGSVGINDQQMFRTTGTLPANYQIGHKVHVAIDGLTNAMMSRATMANLLMTPAYDGAPVYYADPSQFAADTSGLPDEFWKQVARWWSEYNKAVLGNRGYDPAKSGVQNAHDIYEALMAERDRTRGRLTYANSDGKTTRTVKYAELPKDAGDVVSVERWLVREDDPESDGTMLNRLGGGEAMGYLKQFVQASRVLGFGGAAARASIHRILSWSKSMSVSFSFFFPLATRWESPIGAVGAMATMCSNSKTMAKWAHENPEIFAKVQKLFGGDGWITKDFLGFQDIMEMMDSNDPFLAEMKSWASALGITLSSSLVNPMEPTKSVMASDINALKEMLRDKFGAKVAAKFGRVMDAVALRQGDKAFNYALNATKLACVAQLAMKLRHEATKRGKAFDPVRDLRRYSGYINAEIGGIDPLRYAWAHPMNRSLMNTLLFSWQWTRGAWEAGGGGVLEDMLFGGHSVTRQEREYLFGRWCRMFGAVMIGVPALFQVAIVGLSKSLRAALGLEPDPDDKWWTWDNESKTRWTAFDLTPLLKTIAEIDDTKLGGILRRVKLEGGPAAGALGGLVGAALGAKGGGNWVTGAIGGAIGAGAGSMVPSFIPEYTGKDAANQTSRGRRYYMHFGKQGWEFFRWFDDAKSQFFSKLSMPVQRILEGVMGRSLGYLDRSLAWEDMGQFERWLSPTTDSALFNVAQAFLPFSVGGVGRNADAGVLPIFGPVQMGASQTAIQKRLEKAIEAWAHNDRAGYAFGRPTRGEGAPAYLRETVADILADARENGFDAEAQLNKALGQALTREYGRLFKSLPDKPDGDFDVGEVSRIARALNRLGAKKANVMKSIKNRLKTMKVEWRDLPADTRRMYRSMVETSLSRPFTGGLDY